MQFGIASSNLVLNQHLSCYRCADLLDGRVGIDRGIMLSVQCINNKHNDNDRESEDGPFDMTAWMGVTRHRRERYIIGQERSGTMIRRINDLSVPQTH